MIKVIAKCGHEKVLKSKDLRERDIKSAQNSLCKKCAYTQREKGKVNKKIVCKTCQSVFSSKSSVRKFCSKKCSRKFHRKKEANKRYKTLYSKLCIICNKRFSVFSFHNAKVCNNESCRKEHERQKWTKANKKKSDKKKVTLNCVICGKKYQTTRKNIKTCSSKECKGKYEYQIRKVWIETTPKGKAHTLNEKKRRANYWRERKYIYKSYCECGREKDRESKKCYLCNGHGVERRLSFKEMEKALQNKHFLDMQGYYRVEYLGKRYSVHRLVYSLRHRKKIKRGMFINHIDHNKNNNHISNLEEVTPSENFLKAREFYSKEPLNIANDKTSH